MNSSFISRFKLRRQLLPIIALFGCIIVAEAVLGFLLPEGLMTRTLHARIKEIREEPSPSIQIMGDSVAAGGISAGQLQRKLETSRVIKNYSLPGTSPYFSSYVLEAQLRDNAAPRLIVYAPNSSSLGSPMIDRFIGRFETGWRPVQMLRHGVSLSDLTYGGINRLSYTIRYREELRAFATRGDRGFFKNLRVQVPPRRHDVDVDAASLSGEMPVPEAEKIDKIYFPESVISPEQRRKFSVHPYNRRSVDDFLYLAAARDIQVYWVILPTVSSVDKLRGGDAFMKAYLAYLEELKARHPNLMIDDDPLSVMPDCYFLDPWHLNAAGAAIFTDRLASQLSPVLLNREDER